MADAWLDWSGDFIASADGDLLLADGDDEARQAIIRRLLTQTKGYLWHPEYGAGLPQRIGGPANRSAIEAVIRSQIMLESSVDKTRPLTISVDEDANSAGLYIVTIAYVSASTGAAVQLSFTP